MVNESFRCSFLEHGITIFPNSKIAPCCAVDHNYLIPIEDIYNEDRFRDVKENYNDACKECIEKEFNNMPSYRSSGKFFNDNSIRYVDIRNNNNCNLKCRMCNPFSSSKWATELKIQQPLKHADISQYKDIILNEKVEWLYFTGGEPLINGDHYNILQEIIDKGFSKNIILQYNTNLTTIKYKNINIIDMWKKFKKVLVLGSIDSIDDELKYIRSKSDWNRVKKNIKILMHDTNDTNIVITIQLVLSILNIWSLEKTIAYFNSIGININIFVLENPDILSLNVMPDSLKDEALQILSRVQPYKPNEIKYAIKLVQQNLDKDLFRQTLLHILLLDKIRDENLYDLLPFKDESLRIIEK